MQCLNCNNSVKENFCPNCGQKTSTHRFSFSYIFDNGVLNGIFNVNKSFFFTIKELFIRPGHSIREYIQGKRIRHINAFSLLILLIAIEFLLDFGNVNSNEALPEMFKSSGDSLDQILETYPQLTYLIVICATTFSSYLFFRRSKLNFAEHLVMNIYSWSGLIVLGLPLTLSFAFIDDKSLIRPLINIYAIIGFGYAFWFFYQFFSGYNYKKIYLVLRVLLVLIISHILRFITLAAMLEINKFTN